jgi:hypothetical protein
MKYSSIALALAGLVGLAASTQAHHSFPASYHTEQLITLDGVVESWLWRNPHPFIFLNVEENGETVTWHVEFPNATAMAFRGLTPDHFEPGDRLLVVGQPGRDGRRALHYQGLFRPTDGLEFGNLEGMER